MRVSAPHKTLVKAAILTTLLTGLLFSGGEGVRLLPFPIAEQTTCGIEKIAAPTEVGYQENVTRFEKRQEPPAAKKQKADAEQRTAGFGGIILSRVTLATSNSLVSHTEKSHSANQTHASDLNSRPPPIS